MGVELNSSNRKLATAKEFAEQSLICAHKITAAMDDMREIAHTANFGIISKLYNNMVAINSGDQGSGGLLEIAAEGCSLAIELCESIVKSKVFQSGFKAKARAAIDELTEAKSSCQVSFPTTSIPEDGNETWNAELRAKITGAMLACVSIRKTFTLNVAAALKKNKTPEIESTYTSWGRHLEELTNAHMTKLKEQKDDLNAAGIDIGGMLDDMQSAASGFGKGIEVGANTRSIFEEDMSY